MTGATPRWICMGPAALALAGAAAGVNAAESHGVHQHGSAEIEVAVEGSDVAVDFTSPLHSLVGFERAPRDEPEREAVAAARVLLDDPGNLVQLPAEAGCAVVQLDVDWHAPAEEEEESDHGEAGDDDAGHAEHEDAEHEDAEHEDAEHEEGHADATVAIRYRCEQADRLISLDVTAFESFEHLSEVELRAVGAGGAVAASPERGSPRVDLRGLFGR